MCNSLLLLFSYLRGGLPVRGNATVYNIPAYSQFYFIALPHFRNFNLLFKYRTGKASMRYYESETTAIRQFMQEHDNFLVTAHVSADGDAYGAALGMAYLLKQLGKKATVVLDDAVKDEKYRTLWGWDDILCYSPEMKMNFDAAIAVDVSSRKRIGDLAVLLPDSEHCVMIDHHPKEEDFADINLHDTAASSASRLVFELVMACNIEVTEDLAMVLLTGLVFDTGRFSFSNTGKRDFEIAARLIEAGARPEKVSEFMMFNIPIRSLRTIGSGLTGLKLLLDDKIGLVFLPKELIEVDEELDIDPLANYSLSPIGVEVGVFIRETSELFKISLRSKGLINVSEIAQEIGGGGHRQAAGCRFVGTYADLEALLVRLVKKQLGDQ